MSRTTSVPNAGILIYRLETDFQLESGNQPEGLLDIALLPFYDSITLFSLITQAYCRICTHINQRAFRHWTIVALYLDFIHIILTYIKSIRSKIGRKVGIRFRCLQAHRFQELALFNSGISTRNLTNLDCPISQAVRQNKLPSFVFRMYPVDFAKVT